jgi:flagellar operon protein
MNIQTARSIGGTDAGCVLKHDTVRAGSTAGVDFSTLVREKADGLRFSAHARTRIQSRNITLSDEIMSKLDKAVDGAARKGSRDTLVLLSDLAFIVNIPNKTVVTAMEGKSLRENVFTNIDSTVIA